MEKKMVIVWLLIACVVLAMGYVRLAPSDPDLWNTMPDAAIDKTFRNGVIRQIEIGPEGLAQLDKIVMATPRTRRLVGTPEEGQVTYVTRSAFFGFPDYTTARQSEDTLIIYARARFGRSDLGVNQKRVEGWIDAL